MSTTAEEEIHEAEFIAEEPAQKSEEPKQREQPQTAMVYQPAQLLAIAVEKDFDLDKLQKLMDLQERWEEKQALKAFNHALTKFQSRVPEIPKDKLAYGTPYAPLSTIDRTIKDAMQECGLSKTWRLVEEPKQVTVICVLTHEEGHCKEHPIGPVPWDLLEKTKQMNGLQHRAATITYLQRYSLIGALGLSTADVDTDGGQKKGKQKQEEPQSIGDQLRQPRSQGPERINKAQAQELGAAAKEAGMPNATAGAIVQKHGFDTARDITVDKFPAVLKEIKGWTQDAVVDITPENTASPDEIEQQRIKCDELLSAVVDAGYKGNTKVLLKSATGERDLIKVPVGKLPALITRLESELRGLRAMAN